MRYRDFEEFLASCNAHEVRYLVVGAHAVAFHARPRSTKDLDIFVEPSVENAHRLLDALRHFFGGGDLGYTVDDVVDPDTILQVGVAPVRIDLLASLSGVESFDEAWERRVDAPYGEVETHYISLEDLIVAKKSAGRDQDRADLVHLRRTQSDR